MTDHFHLDMRESLEASLPLTIDIVPDVCSLAESESICAPSFKITAGYVECSRTSRSRAQLGVDSGEPVMGGSADSGSGMKRTECNVI
jgi:hypothetical protein